MSIAAAEAPPSTMLRLVPLARQAGEDFSRRVSAVEGVGVMEQIPSRGGRLWR